MRDTALAIGYVFLWASAFIPSRVVSVAAPPLWVLVIRFALAGALLALIMAVRRTPVPRTARAWLEICALGILTNAAYLGLTYEALRHMSSGMGAIIASTNPLILALVAPFTIGERLGWRRLLGLALGFGGVVGVMAARAGSPTERPGDALLALLGVICFVASTVLYKRMRPGVDLAMVTTIQICAASAALVLPAVVLEGVPEVPLTLPVIVSFGYLILVMSIGASFLWFTILRRGEATRVSAYYFLTPVFGLALSALILHEPVSVRDAAGLIAICSGIALVARS